MQKIFLPLLCISLSLLAFIGYWFYQDHYISHIQPQEQFLLILCGAEKRDQMIQEIKLLSSTINTTTLRPSDECRKNPIDKEVLKQLTQKQLEVVHFFGFIEANASEKSYLFSDTEIKMIGQAPWKWLSIDGLSHSQYVILRNETNTFREGFEPLGNPDIYTKEEREKCSGSVHSFIANNTGTNERDSIFDNLIDASIECYRTLPKAPEEK